MSHITLSSARPTTDEPTSLAGLSVRAFLLTALFVAATYLGITRLGFIRINWVPYVVPPIPALLFLMLLQGANILLRALWDRSVRFVKPLTAGELFLIYAGVCICLCMDRSAYIIHYLMVGNYYGTDTNRWKELFELYPDYFVPHDDGIIRGFFEGTPSGRIPWNAWLQPLLWWSAFNMAVVWTVSCFVALFRKQWVEGERLSFPLLFLPLAITGGAGRDPILRRFFLDPVMWVGFALATIFNGVNILHAFIPSVPSLGWYKPVIGPLSEGFLRHFQPISFYFNLEIMGLSYLMSGEMLLSGWFFYFFVKLCKAIGRSLGYQDALFPYFQELSAGACIAVATFSIWIARPHFRELWRAAVGRSRQQHNEPLPPRWLLMGFLAGAGAVVYMMVVSGVALIYMVLFTASLLTFVLVSARVRAEAGPPIQWTHPWGIDQHVPLHLFGTKAALDVLGRKGMVVYYSLFWLGRTIFAESAGSYAIDAFRLADYGRVRRSSMLVILLVGAAVGLAFAWWYHLDVGYRYGQAFIGAEAGRVGAAWSFNWSRGQYTLLRAAIDRPSPPLVPQVAAYVIGFLFAWLLIAARMRISNFPLHPLGFILATLYGENTPYWFPFLVAWTGQRTALRYGGFLLYRRIIPGFLGLAFGHMVVAGILWRIFINYFIDPVVAVRYYINLGG
ncbi:MAG: hypothetical protein H5T86_06195 [Armatimonadetes bacterium]|nr:hypothetical protein [Armatimonadota bacterium]